MVSTPQVARAKSIEKTATITIRFEDSALDGNVTFFLSSSTDSLMYETILNSLFLKDRIFIQTLKRILSTFYHLSFP